MLSIKLAELEIVKTKDEQSKVSEDVKELIREMDVVVEVPEKKVTEVCALDVQKLKSILSNKQKESELTKSIIRMIKQDANRETVMSLFGISARQFNLYRARYRNNTQRTQRRRPVDEDDAQDIINEYKRIVALSPKGVIGQSNALINLKERVAMQNKQDARFDRDYTVSELWTVVKECSA